MSTATQPAWLPPGFVVKQIQANGTGLSVAVGGDGPPIVLLHGWPQTSYAWRRVMAALAVDHAVVVPDLRGAGQSERPESGYAKSSQAVELREMLHQLHLSVPAVVVGHDIGAMVAFGWAVMFPEDVSALVLLDALLPGVDLEDHMNAATGGQWHFGFFMTPDIPEMLFDGHEDEFIATMFPRMGGTDVFSDEDLAHYADAYRGRDRLRGGFEQYRALLTDGAEIRSTLARRKPSMPVLDVVAGQDTDTWQRLHGHVDDLTVSSAPTGHFIAEENPQWFLDELRTFLHVKA